MQMYFHCISITVVDKQSAFFAWYIHVPIYECLMFIHVYMCVYLYVTTPSSLPRTAGMDFAQTGSLVKDRHLMQRQMSASGLLPWELCIMS